MSERIKLGKGDRVLIWDKRGVIVYAAIPGKGSVEVVRK